MDCFVCFMFKLIALGIASAIVAVTTYLIAAGLGFIFRAPVQTMLGAEAIALLVCAAVIGALLSGLVGLVVLALLGLTTCVVILARKRLFSQVRSAGVS